MTAKEINDFIFNNKICIVTNSKCMPGTTFLASMRSYLEYVPLHNFMIIPGYNTRNHTPYYGEEAFSYMILTLYEKRYEYVIYIDDDCFISDMDALIHEFKKFKNSNKCIAGVQDGTAICHRNHSQILINTFISFWNLKNLKIEEFLKIRNFLVNYTYPFKEFLRRLEENKKLYDNIFNDAKESTIRIKDYRNNVYKVDVPYTETVKNDPNNPIEPQQVPYSTDDSTASNNSEPYYATEEAMILSTKQPIYYMFGTDFYDPEEKTTMDNSGITSVVLTSDTHKPFAYHTWFSRMYTRWPKTQQQLTHTKRINTIINNI